MLGFVNMIKVLLSVCCFLTIIHYGLGSSEKNVTKLYEEECSDGYHHYNWYPYDCQKYYSCENGTLEFKSCPDDLNWNDVIKSCDFKDNVDCSNIKPFPDPDCDNGETAYYIYPYDCHNYYECYNGSLYIMICPNDTLWNDDIQKCDESGTNDCSYIIPSPSTTTSTTASTTTTAAPTTTTTTTAAPTTTTTTTTEPTTTSTTTAEPTTTSTTTAEPTTSSTTTAAPTTTSPATTPKIECAYEHEYFAYPYDCSMYYMCSNYKAILMQCPDGEYWDQENLTCDWPWNVNCVASSTPSFIGLT